MSIVLRPYQEDLVGLVNYHIKNGIKSILVQSPTGSGKTALTAHMIGEWAKQGHTCWFIVHRRELVRQSMSAFANDDISFGVVAAKFRENLEATVQIASIRTLAQRIDKLAKPDFIIWDECHHVAALSWHKIFTSLPEAIHIGLSATPERLDGRGLGDYFQEMVYGPDVTWLTRDGYLCPFKIFAPPGVSMRGAAMSAGDYTKPDMIKRVFKSVITGDVVKEYRSKTPGKRAIVFCVSRDHSKSVVDNFNSKGINACHVDGETNPSIRDASIEAFARGQIKVLSNVDLFGEGFDLPATECVILLRPTRSRSLYLQQVGRALRPSQGKDFVTILDHAGNSKLHGLPDELYDWRLDKKGRRFKPLAQRPRACPRCSAVNPPGKEICHHCGFNFKQIEYERQLLIEEGELIEVERQKQKKFATRKQSEALTLEALISLGREKGFKRPEIWADHVLEARKSAKGGI